MATIAEGGLFPPIIDNYMPAFNIETVKSSGLSINFDLSPYNSTLSAIKSYHISITRQSNYESIFDKNKYPLGIYANNFTPVPSSESCTETIEWSKFNKTQINYNEYYKVQVRLSKETLTSAEIQGGVDLSTHLTDEDNLSSFSEWSTVCLIRFIAPPVFKLDANGQAFGGQSGVVLTSSMMMLSGVYEKNASTSVLDNENPLLHNGNNDLEYLASYGVQIISNDNVVFDSGDMELNTHNINSINYTVPYYFEPTSGGERDYSLRLYYTTANLYQGEVTYSFNVDYSSESWGDQGNPVSEITSLDTVIGKVNVNILPLEPATIIAEGSKVTIRRGCEDNNFTIWDTVYSKVVPTNTTMIDFNDFTIESGVIYKYEINYTISDTTYTIVEGPIISVFDHAFLTGEGTQLCVKFNPNVGSYKRNVSDSVVNTIGGKYPYITRNGAMDYKSFSLSGTIAYEMDVEHQFTSRSAIYGDWIDVYGSYFVNHFYNQRNDRVTQRKFREMVEDFLYDDFPKLFRSTPEGNILVRITDVNLTPNNQLGRMIYDFNCIATEIGDCTIDNYKLYQIQDFGDE